MTINDLVSPSPRHLTLLLVCSSTQAFGSSIKYHALPSHDVYVITRLPLFGSYVEKLLTNASDPKHVSVVIVCRDLELTLQAIATVYRSSSAENRRLHKDDLEKSKQHNVLERSSVLPEGHLDLCLAFNVAVVHEDDIGEEDPLSESTVKLQQMLRYVSLKHGMIYAVVSGLVSVVDNASSIVSVTEHLFSNSGSDRQMYNTKGDVVSNSARIHQLISPVWDSWTKISLVAKALPSSTKKDHLLQSEERIDTLDGIYNEYFEELSEDPKNATFARLAELLGIESVDGSTIAPSKPPLTYEEAVIQLQENHLQSHT